MAGRGVVGMEVKANGHVDVRAPLGYKPHRKHQGACGRRQVGVAHRPCAGMKVCQTEAAAWKRDAGGGNANIWASQTRRCWLRGFWGAAGACSAPLIGPAGGRAINLPLAFRYYYYVLLLLNCRRWRRR